MGNYQDFLHPEVAGTIGIKLTTCANLLKSIYYCSLCTLAVTTFHSTSTKLGWSLPNPSPLILHVQRLPPTLIIACSA